jgi:hypothetical protein
MKERRKCEFTLIGNMMFSIKVQWYFKKEEEEEKITFFLTCTQEGKLI